MLEARVCNKTIDYETEKRMNQIQKEMEVKEQEHQLERAKWAEKMDELHNTLQQTMNFTSTSKVEKAKFESQNKVVINESQRLQGLFGKVLASMRGTKQERIIDQMLTSTLTIAKTESLIQERVLANQFQEDYQENNGELL